MHTFHRRPFAIHQLHQLSCELIIDRLRGRIFTPTRLAQRKHRAILVQQLAHTVLRRTARLAALQRNLGRRDFVFVFVFVFKRRLAASSVRQERTILIQERAHAILRRAAWARAALQGAECAAHHVTQLTELQSCARE